jgi:iron complex outermembrane receptor protein
MDPVDPVMLDSIGREESDQYLLKYRRKHLLKSDLQLEFRSISAGINVQYHSRLMRIDYYFIDEVLGNLLMPGFPYYWENQAGDYVLMDLRIAWAITTGIRISGILKNANNVEYVGRPGDIGPPRSFTLQAKFTF